MGIKINTLENYKRITWTKPYGMYSKPHMRFVTNTGRTRVWRSEKGDLEYQHDYKIGLGAFFHVHENYRRVLVDPYLIY